MFDNKENNYSTNIFLLIIIVSYVLGFYLNEDSAGGGKIDYLKNEWGTIQLFAKNELSVALSSNLYESSRTPFFYILNKYNPFLEDLEKFRFFWFFFSFSIPILFYYTLKRIFQKKPNKNLIIIFSFIILLSPYFRTNSFWPSSENLQIFFLLFSILFYLTLTRTVNENKSSLYYLSTLSAFFAYCAFYTDQKSFFLVILIYFDLIRRNNFKFFVFFSLINFLLFIPAIYLFVLWNGIVPVESQFRVSGNYVGTNIFLSTIGIYFVIIFISNFFNKEFIGKININFFDILLTIIFGLFIFLTLPGSPITFGSGIVSKLLGITTVKLNFDWNIIKYIYLLINLLFFLVIYLLIEKNLKNLIILVSFLIVYNLTSFSYQSYVDPVFYILILTIFDFKKSVNFFDKKTSYLFLSFYTLMLTGSIIMRTYVI